MAYNNVEKIANEIYRPCSNYVLKHNVKIARKNYQGKRETFHNEFSYTSNVYLDKKYLKMIKLNYMSFLTLEEVGKDWTERESLIINNSNIHIFRKKLKKVKKWFYKKKYESLFYYEGNDLKLSMEFKGIKEVIETNRNVIVFTPSVIEINDELYEGVDMYINTTNSLGQIPIDRFEALYTIIKNFDLYLSGMALINYLGMPEVTEKNNHVIPDNKFFKTNESSMETKGDIKNYKNEKLNGFFK